MDGNNLQRQKLLKHLLSNVLLYNKELTFTINDPYKAFIKQNKKPQSGANNTNWCG